ncbi:zinc finger BED domain-containing protein 5-like [Acyrthosiphon pisum]|uniref:Uncharacterized protein n=1 Tax=Acyrthosiphon pisum TaxID=7029 RepID=A0A8R2FBJ8_ACYPI|nr:zinc finger BED domain-containing protein 5-like [Acyrthosiphon pisum]|eukprot:XP_008186759.1 PREDICTED: zinc finger BED domain-containing protein 5-like [Acyrthosiphon pisum]
MSSQYGGLQALIRQKAPEMIWTHCLIHREALASQYISCSLNCVLEIVIKVVNYVKIRPVKARFFQKLCEEMGAEHTTLLFYCKETHILQLYDKIVAFIKKINSSLSLKTIFLEHLTNLETHFMKYFPEEMKQYYWIKDPFTEKPPSNFTTTEEEQLIDISSDSSLRMQFSSYSLLGFWNSIKALRILIPFATSYLCEAGFSVVAVLKSKYRSKLNVEKEMRVAVTTLIPNFEKLINEKQAHCSH